MQFLSKPLTRLLSLGGTAVKKEHRRILSLSEGGTEDGMLLSTRFAALCELSRIGICTPPALFLTTMVAAVYLDNANALPVDVKLEVVDRLRGLEEETGKIYGATRGVQPPLLLCVRVGVPMMPADVMADLAWCGDGCGGTGGGLDAAHETELDTISLLGAPEV